MFAKQDAAEDSPVTVGVLRHHRNLDGGVGVGHGVSRTRLREFSMQCPQECGRGRDAAQELQTDQPVSPLVILSGPIMTDSHGNSAPRPLKVLCVDDNEDAADTPGRCWQWSATTWRSVTTVHRRSGWLRAAFRPDVAILDIQHASIDGCQLASALRLAAREAAYCSSLSPRLGDTGRSNAWPIPGSICTSQNRSSQPLRSTQRAARHCSQSRGTNSTSARGCITSRWR